MTIIRHGSPESYYSQRNNAIDPMSSCNVTAMVDAIEAAGWVLPFGGPEEPKQPEDRLHRFIDTDAECQRLWRSVDPRGTIPAVQWMAVLALGANRWMGTVLDQWVESAHPVRMLMHLADGGTCVVVGQFPGTQGHVVALVGVAYDEADPSHPRYWIIDDPWGDYHTGYSNQRGAGVEMPASDFREILRPCGEFAKWCHFIRHNDGRG
jgi:hypothetical protein